MDDKEFTYLYENNGGDARRLICKHWTDTEGFKPAFLHCHTEFEFMLIVSGDIRVVNNSIDLRIEPPCILLHRPYTFHVIHAESDIIYERYHFYFSMSTIAKIAELYPRLGKLTGCNDLNIFRVSPDSIDEWLRLLDSYTASSESDEEIRTMYAGIALGKMLGLQAIPTPGSNRQKSYIQDVIGYIQLHLSEPLSVDELAERYYVSRSKLIRDFSRYASCSIHEYITTLRLDRSCQLLRMGKNVTNTAMECGFNYVSSFIRTFRQRFGMSPLQYAGRMNDES